MSTIKDVAKYANVSIATVSKYLNGGNVLEINRTLIEEGIKSLDYKINVMARGLKTNKSMTIGVLIPSLEKIFFTTIISDIENVLLKNGYSTIICDYQGSYDLEIKKLEFLISKSVDGIFMVAGTINGSTIKKIIGDTPIILLDRMVDDIKCDAVLTDSINASYNAVEHLISENHRKIGIICGPRSLYTARERYQGYLRVHEDYKIKLNDNLIKFGDYTIKSGYNAMCEIWKSEDKPTALYVTNYEMTIGVIMAVNELKIEIPKNLSIIGFDNILLAEICNPSLTIVVQPMDEIARKASKIMLKRLKNDSSNFPEIYRLKTKLLIKNSTDKL